MVYCAQTKVLLQTKDRLEFPRHDLKSTQLHSIAAFRQTRNEDMAWS
jgi:hypothetical protein